MKWGGKKSCPSQSPTWTIARVFPVSWFSKFKQKGGGPETSSTNKKQRGKLDFSALSSSLPAGWRDCRFYSMDDDDDDDAYWRLSFHAEGIESRRNAGVISPLWYDSDDEFQIPVFSCKSLGFREVEVQRRQEHRSFKDLDLKRMRGNEYYEGNILREHGVLRRRKPNGEALLRIPRKKHDSVVSSSRNQRYISFPNLGLSSLEEDYAFAALTGEGSSANSERASISEWQNSEDKKCKEMKLKTESQRKSAYVRRELHSRKIKQTRGKACLPKTEGRIGVLEDLKRARIKVQRKTAKVQVAEGATIFDSFAVVKSSFNPQQDFRDSMVEMIRAKRIRRPEELQELLACYLTLNHDGHHELIIKVFQELKCQ
ncbi:UNVERIFIED_CONTAM: Transcription repressor OFP5 [Sesamum calycinum]|uniref:Transcription repressor n=1 Tax=Sesamum calycinum TaxID=2727403 RepID=A0AAW2Q6K1_9LAMI